MLSASGLYRANACAASEAYPATRGVSSADADFGTDMHLFLQHWVDHGQVEALKRCPENRKAYALRLHPSVLDAGLFLQSEVALVMNAKTGQCRRLGSGLSRDYPIDEATDVPGTTDVAAVMEDTYYSGDWKFGRQLHTPRAVNNLQAQFNAAMGAQVYGKDNAIAELIFFDDDGGYHPDRHVMDRMECDAVLYKVRGIHMRVTQAREMVRAGQTPNVTEGDHCKWCPAWLACPAKKATLVTIANDATAAKDAVEQWLTPQGMAKAYQRWREMKEVMRVVDARMMAALKEYGPIDLGNGRKYGFRASKKRSIDLDKAKSVLVDKLGEEGYQRALRSTVSQSSIGEVLGTKGKALEAVMEALEAAGAIEFKEGESPEEYSDG